jgi:hypothetical protein
MNMQLTNPRPKSSEFMNVSLPMSLNQPPSEGGA